MAFDSAALPPLLVEELLRERPPFDLAADGDPEGREWIASMPQLLDDVCNEWGLELGEERPTHGYNSFVVSVRRGSEACALKVTWPQDRTLSETRALEAWAGRGAVMLLKANPHRGVVLLERLDAARTLVGLELPEAAAIAGGLLRRLAIPPPSDIPRLSDLASEIYESIAEHQRQLGNPVPRGQAERAQDLARSLGATTGDRLIHADLHYGNVLAAEREPWLAIDPKPVIGDPGYDAYQLVVHGVHDAPHLRARIARVAGDLGLDVDRLRAWTLARSVEWALWAGRNDPTTDYAVECADLARLAAEI